MVDEDMLKLLILISILFTHAAISGDAAGDPIHDAYPWSVTGGNIKIRLPPGNITQSNPNKFGSGTYTLVALVDYYCDVYTHGPCNDNPFYKPGHSFKLVAGTSSLSIYEWLAACNASTIDYLHPCVVGDITNEINRNTNDTNGINWSTVSGSLHFDLPDGVSTLGYLYLYDCDGSSRCYNAGTISPIILHINENNACTSSLSTTSLVFPTLSANNQSSAPWVTSVATTTCPSSSVEKTVYLDVPSTTNPHPIPSTCKTNDAIIYLSTPTASIPVSVQVGYGTTTYLKSNNTFRTTNKTWSAPLNAHYDCASLPAGNYTGSLNFDIYAN